MVSLIAELYVAAVAVLGFGLGLWLHTQLDTSGQIQIAPRSPFKTYSYSLWTLGEGRASA